MPSADGPHPPDPCLHGGDRAAPAGDGKYGKGDVNRRYHETRQALYSYSCGFDFPTDAGLLNYLNGQEFHCGNCPVPGEIFSQKYLLDNFLKNARQNRAFSLDIFRKGFPL